MTDNIQLASGTGGDILAADEIPATSQIMYQRVKITLGDDGDNDGDVHASNPMPITGSAVVTNGGTFAVQDSEKLADNAAFVDGTSKVQPAGFIFDEVAGTTLTENDAGAARMDSKRAQVAVIEDETTRGRRVTVTASNALKVDGSAVTQPVSGTVTANAGTNLNTSALALESGGNLDDIATDIATLAGAVAAGQMQVDVVAALPTGTNQIGRLAANSGVDIGDVDVTTMPATAADGAPGPAVVMVAAGLYGATTSALTMNLSGDLKVTLDGETVTLGAGSSQIGTLGTNPVGTPVNVQVGDGTTTADVIAGTPNNALAVALVDDAGAQVGAFADVFDLTNSNPVAVAIVDGLGDQITSFGGGTQYTEGVTAAATPVGTMPVLEAKTSPASEVTAGQNVGQKGTIYGAAFVQVVDSSGNYIDSFGGAGGTSSADDAAFVQGTTLGTPAMGVYESSPTSVTNNEMGIIGITATRELKVSAASLPLPSGAATESSLASIDGKITACNTGAVTISAALPAGTNTLGAVKVTDGTTTATVIAGTPNNALAVALVDDAGVQAGAFADVFDLTNSNPVAVAIVDGLGDQITSFGGGTQYTLGTDTYTEGTSVGTLAGAVRNDALAALAGTDNELAPLQVNALGALYVDLEHASGADGVTAPSECIVVAGKYGANTSALTMNLVGDLLVSLDSEVVSVDTEFPAGSVLSADARSSPDTTVVGSFPYYYNGATWDRARGDLTNGLLVNLGGNNDVVASNGGTFAVQEDGAALTALQIMDDWDETDRCKVNPIAGQAGVQGGSGTVTALTQRVVLATDVGLPAGTSSIGSVTQSSASAFKCEPAGAISIDDAVSATKPLLTGARAQASSATAPSTRVGSDGDAQHLALDRDGALYTHPHPPQITGAYQAYTSAANSVLISAPASGSLYITDIWISFNGANTVDLRDGTTTVIWRMFGSAAGDGASVHFQVPIKLTATTALQCNRTAATAVDVRVNAYIAP